MDVRVLELVEGSREARGLTVIIDVFRAFSLECQLFDQGVERIIPMGSVEDALALKREHPEYVSFGERGGKQVDGFEYGNSPAQVAGVDLAGKTCIHTTSAGTQGIVNAVGATEILGASLVNAAATARYIRERDPEVVSIVAMGNAGIATAAEDVICARYIRALLLGEEYDAQSLAYDLRETDGAKFFDPAKPEFPEGDFERCVTCDMYDFVVRVSRKEDGTFENTRYVV